jgi:predicted Zn-dependent protease
MRFSTFLILIITTVAGLGCSKVNVFSLDRDRELGAQVNAEILANPAEYPILPERGNEEVYRYIRGITTTLLNSGKVKNRDEFLWEVRIINDDATLNAFATPGGYIYVYTGLIKYLDSEEQLAGVMGHEIAHADLRHSTKALTKQYGLSVLLQAATIGGGAGAGQLGEIAAGLTTLSFGRAAETEADSYSVVYMCPTSYEADGAADFFIKLNASSNGDRPPAFLSTHPNPGNRVENIQEQAKELGCSGTATNKAAYDRIKALL